MNRSQDTVIDDDEETCPLCIEEFDLSDKNFKPCPCGYQICQFCFNSLKTTYEKSTCPNCRRPYDESTIQYKIPTAEEFKLDQMNKNKKQAAAKRKETEKREVENSTRRHLAGVRVKQQNLVYVIGLEPTKKDETMLLETLRGKDYFGQYGEIEKIVVSKAKPGATNQGIGVYVTFKRKEDAATCIEAVDGSHNGERILRAQFGTTKYCSAFLRGETCMNKNCSFLHETGEDGHHTSLQNEPSDGRHSARPPFYTQTSSINRTGTTPQPGGMSLPMVRQASRETLDSRKGSNDASALPPSAGWANVNAPTSRVRRASQVASTPSPQLVHTILSSKMDQPKSAELSNNQQDNSMPAPKATKSPTKPTTPVEVSTESNAPEPSDQNEIVFDSIRRLITIDFVPFIYDDSWMPPDERARIADMPPLYDPYGGAKRRLMEDKEAAEHARVDAENKAKLEAQAKSAAEEALDEDPMATGSLALGGEPEDNPRSSSARGTIGRPNQPGSGLGDQFTNLRSLTPQQRQQLGLLNTSGIQQAPGLPQPPVQNTAFEMSDFDRRGPQYSQAQYDQISNHQRHGSRYFNNDSKSSSNNRFQGQQQPFYSSGVQGPPPGLPTAGTPPVSGGGMFAHGQGFTNTGFGTTKDTNAELHLRGRSGTNSGHDMSKRGGVEHLADPSILQARIHQGGATGQGLFGGNQVDKLDFPPLPTRSDTRPELHSRVSSLQGFHGPSARASTPKVPPGFENTHAHPMATNVESVSEKQSPTKALIAPVLPIVPNLTQRMATPKNQTTLPHTETGSNAMPRDHGNIQQSKDEDVGTHIKNDATDAKTERSPPGTKFQQTASLQPEVKNVVDVPEMPTGQGKLNTKRPTKIEIPPSMTAAIDRSTTDDVSQANHKSSTPILDSTMVTTPDAMFSRPITPVTTTSETSKASIARPRTLRLTTSMIQQAEAASSSARVASPAATEKSAVLPALSHARREHSRHPSVSSVSRSRPSSPSASDRLMSQDVSRAGSPPPGGIVGSAPSRAKSKAQAKKERKEKAKKAEADEGSVTGNGASTAVEEVGPIIARQKKQKRSKTNSMTVEDLPENMGIQAAVKTSSKTAKSDASISSSKIPPTKRDSKVDPMEIEAPAAAPETPVKAKNPEVPARPYTVRDLYSDSLRHPNSPTAIQALLSSHVSPMSKILSEMITSGDLPRDHPWLTNASFTSAAYKLPSDSRRGQDYLDANGYSSNSAFGYLYIDSKDKKVLRSGVSVPDPSSLDRSDDLLNNFLLTPRGWVMRHLTNEESERVQELEYRRFLYEKDLGEFGMMTGLSSLEQDDFINLSGGLNELIHNGDRHGVHWVMSEHEADQDQGYGDDRDTLSYDHQPGDDDLLLEVASGDNDDETDEDISAGYLGNEHTMPGAWDPGFDATTAADISLTDLPANTLPPIHGIGKANVNLRTMDADTLHKRIQEKHRDVDSARREMEKAEKMLTKKGKEFGKWRDALLKA